ncbi:MAG: hypothetical protein ACNI27_02210 [Desulfovibrio sp.]
MSEWVVMESFTKEELEKGEVDGQGLYEKWLNVADDMALIPENNVTVDEENDVIRVKVSTVLYDCMAGR